MSDHFKVVDLGDIDYRGEVKNLADLLNKEGQGYEYVDLVLAPLKVPATTISHSSWLLILKQKQ